MAAGLCQHARKGQGNRSEVASKTSRSTEAIMKAIGNFLSNGTRVLLVLAGLAAFVKSPTMEGALILPPILFLFAYLVGDNKPNNRTQLSHQAEQTRLLEEIARRLKTDTEVKR